MTSSIVYAAQKGGSGKSAVVTSTAVCALQAGLKVAILDLDPQKTSSDWGSLRQKRLGVGAHPIVYYLGADHLDLQIATFAHNGYDLVVIDTAGTDSPEVDVALRLADLTIVPCVPSPPDLVANRVTFTKAKIYSKQAFYVLNKVMPQGTRANEAREHLKVLQGRWLSAFLALRVDHQDSYGCGLGVTEYNPKGRAADEIKSVWNEIAALLGLISGE